jgi:hypothetical protein
MYVSTSSEIRSDARKRAVGLINDNKERHKNCSFRPSSCVTEEAQIFNTLELEPCII